MIMDTNMTMTAWALSYLAKGFSPTPVAFEGKNPILPEWQTLRLTQADIAAHFNGVPRNIGILLGEPSNGVVDIDLDVPEAVLLAPYLLNPTGWRFGRAGSPESHWLYKASPLEPTARFQDPDGTVLVEHRSTGAQTVFPPSVHESGELIWWAAFDRPATIDGKVLKRDVSRLAAATSLARNWPKPGGRQEAALALAGGLLRAAWDLEAVKIFIGAISKVAGDEESEKRVSAAAYTKGKQIAGEPTTGWPKLAELLGQSVVDKVCRWLQIESSSGGVTVNESETGWPPLSPLPSVAPQVPALSPELIPEAFRRWLVDCSGRACIPLELAACPALVALGSVVGRTLGIRPRRWDDWLVVPNLWGAVVARSGALKSHAVGVGVNPVNRLANKAREKFQEDQVATEAYLERINAEVDALKGQMRSAAKGDDGDLDGLQVRMAGKKTELQEAGPRVTRYLTQDATVEKLGELLRDNPRGMLVVRDEIAGLLFNLDKPGREGDREFYLEAWNGTGGFTVDRIGRGTVWIPALTLSICGGIQPGKLSSYISDAIGDGKGADGLLQRFQLLVWPDGLGKWDPPERWPDNDAKYRAFQVFSWLDNLDPNLLGAEIGDDSIPSLRFAPDAQDFFDVWHANLENRLRSDEMADSPAFESHMAKYRSLMPSLALLFHLVDVATETIADISVGPDVTEEGSGTSGTDVPGGPSNKIVSSSVSLEAARRAADWCEFLEAHARKVYATELYPGVQSAHFLKEKIGIGEVVDKQSLREIYRHHWTGLKNPAQVKTALEILEEAGWVRVDDVQTDGRPGQVLRLNPDLRDGASTGN